MTDTVPLRILRTLASVADTGSVSRAARALHQSASSVSRAVQSAEDTLGIRLFDRGPRGVSPTAAGKVLALRANRAMHVLRAAAEGLQLRGAPASVAALPRLVSDTLLHALAARAEHLTETAAAHALGLSQSALHQALGKLEHVAKVQLFERTRVGTRLNESGRWLLQHAQQALDEIRIAHEELAPWRGLTGRHVSIGALPMAGDVLVPRAAALALALQPDLRLAVKDGTYDALIDMLRAADIDFVVGPLRGDLVAPDLVEEVLFVDRFVAVVRAGHPLLKEGRRKGKRKSKGKGKGIDLDDMVAYPWIGALPGTPAQRAFDRLFAAAGVAPPAVSLQAHSTAVVRSVLLSGDHIALVSPLQVRAEVDAGLLVHACGPFDGTERAIGIAQRRDGLASTACANVLEALRNAAREATGNK